MNTAPYAPHELLSDSTMDHAANGAQDDTDSTLSAIEQRLRS